MVTVDGHRVGRTPLTVMATGFERTTITLTKDGYAGAMERVAPKQNGMAIKITLRKK